MVALSADPRRREMAYRPKDFKSLLGLEGFSDEMLQNHLTLYDGYVSNTNKLVDTLAALARSGKGASPEFAELRRRFGWEWNGMRLHELYFGNLRRAAVPPDKNSPLARKIADDFGSYASWEREFKATGQMRGIGWVILYYDPIARRLLNAWIDEHDVGHLSGCSPLLVLDVYEHAYMLDYGIKRGDYIDAFFRGLHWPVVQGRFTRPRRLRRQSA